MNGRHFMGAGLVAAVVLLCVIAGVGMSVYNMGVMQGVMDGGRYAPAPVAPAVPAPSTAPAPYPYYGPSFRPFGGGFLSFIGPLIGLAVLFTLFRMIFRSHGGHWRGHHGRGWGEGGVPPMFEEWHRRAHQAPPQSQGPTQPPFQQNWGPTPPPFPQPPTPGPNPER
ncbi:MAG: hypothetical protein WCF84_09115 [Anaerolineae bacterium]